MIVTSKYLKRCVLWEGSEEQTQFLLRGIQVDTIINSINRLERCDDKTPNEIQYLQALKQTLADPLGL